MQKELTIFIVDDHELFRDGTTSLIMEIADASSEQNAGTGQINWVERTNPLFQYR